MTLIELKHLIAKKLGIALSCIGAEDFKAYGVRFQYLGSSYRATTDLTVEKVDGACLVTDDDARHIEKLLHGEEWDGEGLPPVGCECEWQDKNTKLWIPVVIAYSSEWVTVVRELKPLKVGDAVECCINNFGEEERLHFRPIRSEADKKKENVVDEIMSWMHYAGRAEVELIYDAIKSGKIVID